MVTLQTNITNINDRPTAANGTLTGIEEDNLNPPGATVASIGLAYSDTTDNQSGIAGGGNAATPFGGIAVVGNAANPSTEGSWQYPVDGDASWKDLPAVSDTSALLLASSARLRFVPVGDFNGSPGAVSIRVSDTPVSNSTGVNLGGTGTAIDGSYGSLAVGADGSYRYTLDNNSATDNALKTGQTLTETYTYTLTDADGDNSSTTLTITINLESPVNSLQVRDLGEPEE